ncbi:MAG: acyl--CoA ligase [Deltaproteobacteria bacterium]|nr:acyl--CoA ligase [Deltaproteobacteria bacterium]
MRITEYKTYEEARNNFTWDKIWGIKFADGRSEQYTFDEISSLTSQFANALEAENIQFGDRVAIMLEPSLEFYVSLFGTVKRGAVVVPCFTLFGPEALQHRIQDSGAKLLITTEDKTSLVGDVPIQRIITTGSMFNKWIGDQSSKYTRSQETSGNDVAIIQYSSGTTRKFPEGIDHFHRSVALLAPIFSGMGQRVVVWNFYGLVPWYCRWLTFGQVQGRDLAAGARRI